MEILTLTNMSIILVGIIAGFLISKLLEKTSVTKTIDNATREATRILKSAETEGESLKKDKMFQAKERFLELKYEHEKNIINHLSVNF